MSKATMNERTKDETDKLMELFRKMPKPTTEPTPESPKKEAKWKHKSVAPKNAGRVNRTKGK